MGYFEAILKDTLKLFLKMGDGEGGRGGLTWAFWGVKR